MCRQQTPIKKTAKTKRQRKQEKKDNKSSKGKNDSENKDESHEITQDDNDDEEEETNDDWEMDHEKYSKVAKDHCILLRKLLQVGNDISIDNSLSKEKKFAILQNIGFSISRIDNKINSMDSFMDVDTIFKMPIDNSIYVTSDLKKNGWFN